MSLRAYPGLSLAKDSALASLLADLTRATGVAGRQLRHRGRALPAGRHRRDHLRPRRYRARPQARRIYRNRRTRCLPVADRRSRRAAGRIAEGRSMAFLFNSDAARARSFATFSRAKLPDLQFFEAVRIRRSGRGALPHHLDGARRPRRATAISKCCSRSAPASTSSTGRGCLQVSSWCAWSRTASSA